MPAVPFTVVAQGAVGPQVPGGVYKGYAARETGGTNPVNANIRDGSVTGNIIETVHLAAGLSDHEDRHGGVRFDKGLFVEVTGTGVIQLTVYID